jgi:glycosyltransferase involved in cell wall biosynthesis
MAAERRKLLYFVTEDWYFVSHRLALAVAAQKAGFDVSVLTRVRRHGEVIASAGLRLIPFENSRGGVNPFVELSMLFRLLRIWLKERPDVAHLVAIKPVIYGSLVARIAGTPRVVNAIAGLGWLAQPGTGLTRCLKAMVRRTFRVLLRTRVVLVQNPDDARALLQLGIPEAAIRRIAGAGVDLRAFRAKPEPNGVPVIVFSGRLLREKGVAEFVTAARLLRERGVSARFVVAGESDLGNSSAVPAAQLAAWAKEGCVEFRGWVADMAGLLASSHVMCLPSYYGEGIPKSLIEAAAAGRPIVTSDMPGCREAVAHGENGLLVPPRNAVALADALNELIDDPELRRRMGARGRARAESEFGLDSIIRQTLALYS